jgi:hypothetical protein
MCRPVGKGQKKGNWTVSFEKLSLNFQAFGVKRLKTYKCNKIEKGQ